MEPLRILIADDHKQIRRTLRNYLHKSGVCEVIGEAHDGIQALILALELEPDILLLDVEMPGLRGTDVALELKKHGKELSILAISAHKERQFIKSLLESGAAGYILKDEALETILTALEDIRKGQRGWVSQDISELLTH